MFALNVEMSNSIQTERNMIVVTDFLFDYEPNGLPFGSQSKENHSLRSYSFWFEKNPKCIPLNVRFECRDARIPPDEGRLKSLLRFDVFPFVMVASLGIKGYKIRAPGIRALSYWGVKRSALIGPPLCRKMLVSRTANVRDFPVWWQWWGRRPSVIAAFFRFGFRFF